MRKKMKIHEIERTKLNISTALICQIVTVICGIIAPRFLLKAFGSSIYGISVSITQFLSYITLLESGIGGVARAELYGPLAREDHRRTSAVYHAVKRFFMGVALAFLAYTVVLGIVYKDIAHVETFSRGYLFALVLIISLSTLAKYMGGMANLTLIVADRRQYINHFITTGMTIANTVAIVILVNMKADLLWVKLGSSVIFVMRPVMYSLYVKKHYTLPKVSPGEAKLPQKWTGIGQHIAYFLHTNTDVVLLTLFADTSLVAVYAVYNMVIGNIRSITESFSSGMEAEFGRCIAQGQYDQLKQAYRRFKTLLVSISMLLFCCTGILIVPFVKLYTAGITDADYIQPIFSMILLMAEAVNCMVLPCSCMAVAANHIKQTKMGAYGEAVINVCLSCALIFWEPLLGVAIATLVATIFRAVYYLRYAAKHFLKMPVWRCLATFSASLAALWGGIVLGRMLLDRVIIDNYFQWALAGAVTFLILVIPTAFFYVQRSKR